MRNIGRLVERISRYEQGDMDEKETIELFQELYDIGLVWELQGHYGRTANELINNGKIRA
jgi:hypothetical protein